MKTEIEINSCRECPYVTNSAQLHDDPFTSHSYILTWYCNKLIERQSGYCDFIVHNPDEILCSCPLKDKK